MTREIRKELIEAKKLYKSKKYEEALAIYEKHFQSSPEVLNNWDKIFYSWSLYQLYIKDAQDEDKLFESAERKAIEIGKKIEISNSMFNV